MPMSRINIFQPSDLLSFAFHDVAIEIKQSINRMNNKLINQSIKQSRVHEFGRKEHNDSATIFLITFDFKYFLPKPLVTPV